MRFILPISHLKYSEMALLHPITQDQSSASVLFYKLTVKKN